MALAVFSIDAARRGISTRSDSLMTRALARVASTLVRFAATSSRICWVTMRTFSTMSLSRCCPAGPPITPRSDSVMTFTSVAMAEI